jgi:hypothetical protein
MSEMTKAPRIIAAMARVMAEVGAVGKTRKNTAQNYQFRGVDDVVAHVQEVMAKCGVVLIPRILEREREWVDTKSGGRMVSVRLLVEHTFWSEEDGSSLSAITLGEAMDSGDKASNKAMSAALKYCLTESLLIATYEVDRDTEEHSPQLAPPPAMPKAAPKPPASPPPSNVRPIVDTLPWEARINEASDMATLMALGEKLAKESKQIRDAVRPLFTARHTKMAAEAK